jgi:myo-inositol-1-phosphate synthase
MKKIRVAVVGVGNCASSLIQGVRYYETWPSENGITRSLIGSYQPTDIEFVAAFDVDRRKVGQDLYDAIYAKPNCAMNIMPRDQMGMSDCLVSKGPVLDGVADHMRAENELDAERFYVDDKLDPVDVAQVLVDSRVDILINYLPVGSQQATEYYASACIDAGVAFMNCIPVFIASDPEWERRFVEAGLPLIGDDMKSQFGASIVSQMLQELAFERGHKVKCHIQENVGGNTDFFNMTDKDRLASKKISKENVIRSQNEIRNIDASDSFLYAGPSNYIRHYGDNKVATFRVELEGFGGAPVTLDARLSVQDSPNSAGIVIDGIRYLRVAQEMGVVGALRGPSAFTQKTPPKQMTLKDSVFECDKLADRELTNITRKQSVLSQGTQLLTLNNK